ncbi:MAG: hypothetical protein ABI557_00625 [Aureliella sp.]
MLSVQYDQKIVEKLNAAIRAGRYNSKFWSEATGKDEHELNSEWLEFHRKKILNAATKQ